MEPSTHSQNPSHIIAPWYRQPLPGLGSIVCRVYNCAPLDLGQHKVQMFVQFVQFVQYICTIAAMMRDAPLFLDSPHMSQNTKGSFLRITASLDPACVWVGLGNWHPQDKSLRRSMNCRGYLFNV